MNSREAELIKQLQEKDDQLQEANRKIELLQQKVDLLVRRMFGSRAEKLDRAQLLLLLEGIDEPGKSPEPVAAEAPRRSKGETPPRERSRARLPEHLPVVEEIIEPEAVKAAPQAWRRIGEEVSEKLDYEPARFLCRRIIRPKYVERRAIDAAPVIAPLPPSLLEGSMVSAGLLAHVVVAKYCDHLPLYRQQSIYWSRHQVWLPRQTLAEWVGLAADWLQPIYHEINKGVFDRGYVQVDETPVRYLSPGHGQTKLGYFWTCGVPRGDVVFHWRTSRAASNLDKIIPVEFSGTIQCDGYEGYDCFAKGRDKIVLAGCMAHVRRKFFDARDQAPRVVGWMLQQFGHLYEVEAQLRKTRAGPKLRQAKRTSASAPVLRRMYRALMRFKNKHRFLPASLMGKAIDYALRQWASLRLFLEDGLLEIDNNLIENAIRPTAIGKKNWLFIGEASAGQRSAIIYTVIECCRRRGIDPLAYLREVFTRLPSMTNWQIKDITPEAWAKSQRRADHRIAA